MTASIEAVPAQRPPEEETVPAPHIPAAFKLQTERVPFRRITEVFAETRNGKRLGKRIRFGDPFKPKDTSHNAWVELLGADVNNRDHMPLTDQLAYTFLRYCEVPPKNWQGPVSEEASFSDHEKSLLRLTAVTHDQAESLPKHYDRRFDIRTAADEAAELKAMQGLFQRQAKKLELSPADERQYARHLQWDVRAILGDRESKLGKAFNAIERLGYLRTGVRAWELGQKQKDGQLNEHLQWLASNVLGNQMQKLLEYADVYPPVHFFLEERAVAINAAFANIPEAMFEKYEEAERVTQAGKFEKAKAAWIGSRYAPQ
jgi:hypothetical protein